MEIEVRIREINIHWRGEKLSKWPYKRNIFAKIWADIQIKPMSLITGIRRTGKSVIVKQMIDKLIESGTNPNQILFFEFMPNDTIDLQEQIWKYFITSKANREEKMFVFLDEVQYIKDYELVIKNWYDMWENVKFVLTGSFSLLYKKETRESLAGRYFDYRIFPLSFKEYREMSGKTWVDYQGIDELKGMGLADSLNYDFRNFLKWGRLPETIGLTEEQAKNYGLFLRNQMITRDAFIYFEIRQPNVLMSIFEHILKNNGGEISAESLARQLGTNKITVRRYLEILAIMGLIYVVPNTTNPLKVGNVARKLYVCSVFCEERDEDNMGRMVESYFLERLLEEKKQVTFFRKRDKEVDFLVAKEKMAYEVKFSHKIEGVVKYEELAKNLGYKLSFVTLNQFKVLKIESIPACLV